MVNTPFKSILCVISIFSFQILHGQSSFDKGESYFAKRYENARGLIAPSKNINTAIKFYKKEKTPQSIAALLRAYEFKGSYTKQAKTIRKKIYSKAVRLGKMGLESYPDEISIKYYYMANLGRWGQSISIMKAHEKGVLDEVKGITEELIQLNTDYDEAGAERILGAIHLKVPRIPFVLTWPSEDTALELLKSAYEKAPYNVGNGKLYAEALLESGDKELAKSLLEDIMKRKPRNGRLLEDQKNLDEAGELYRDTFQ
jgi:tetratricopeptide (TPR) repeat protein